MKLIELFTTTFNNQLKDFFFIRAKEMFSDQLDESFGTIAFDLFYRNIDHMFEYELLWNYNIEWYQSKILQVIDHKYMWYLSELMNWTNKGKPFTVASLNDVNNFCSSITKTSTTPYNNDSGQEPEWNYQSNTNRNYLLLDAPQLKWIRFDGLKKISKEISFLLKTVL